MAISIVESPGVDIYDIKRGYLIVHLPPLFPYLPYLLPRFLRRDPDILIKILDALMPADLHDQLRRGSGKEFIGAERPAAGVGGDPGVFGFQYLDILVALLIGCLDRGGDARQLADLLNMPVQLLIGGFVNNPFETVD